MLRATTLAVPGFMQSKKSDQTTRGTFNQKPKPMANINEMRRKSVMNILTLDNKLSMNVKKSSKLSKNIAAEKRKKYKSKQTHQLNAFKTLTERDYADRCRTVYFLFRNRCF